MTSVDQGPAPADVLLADGRLAIVRPLREGDGPALHETEADMNTAQPARSTQGASHEVKAPAATGAPAPR